MKVGNEEARWVLHDMKTITISQTDLGFYSLIDGISFRDRRCSLYVAMTNSLIDREIPYCSYQISDTIFSIIDRRLLVWDRWSSSLNNK